MNKSLSSSFRNESVNHYDQLLQDRIKHLVSGQDTSVWDDWEIQFMGNIKMMKGEDESNIVEKSGIVIRKLNAAKMAGKVTLSMLPKFKPKDLQPIMKNLVWRSSNMDYHPITRLNLTGTKINRKMMHILVNTVLDHNQYPYLKWLNFSQCGLTSKISNKKSSSKSDNAGDEEKDERSGLDLCSSLSVGLAKNKSLQFLFLTKNRSIEASGLKTILDSVTRHPSLRMLRYDGNSMSIEHAKVFSAWFAQNPFLPRIAMRHCSITDSIFLELIKGLAQNPTLFELDLAQNAIGDDGIAAFSQKVLMNPKTNVMRLKLFDNCITVDGAHFLSKAVATNWTLTELDLSNQIGDTTFGDEAVNVLCKGLLENESLQTLRLSRNYLSSAACYGIGQVLKAHSNLRVLELSMNKQIGSKGFEYIAEGLQDNWTLKILSIGGTSPGKDGAVALKIGLKKQSHNTKQLIQDVSTVLRECDAIKECVEDNDVDSFSEDLVHSIIDEFVGYALLKQLDLKNCFPNLWEPGVADLVLLISMLEQQNHALSVVW